MSDYKMYKMLKKVVLGKRMGQQVWNDKGKP